MKRTALLPLLSLTILLAACGGGGGGDAQDGVPQGVADFLHFTTTENTSSSSTALSHPLANGNPAARVFVTHNWNPSGASGTYHAATNFVRYDSADGRWYVTSLGGDMPLGRYFNVTVVSGFASAWVHEASAADIVANGTALDQPAVNGDSTALLLATKAAPQGGGVAIMPSYEIGTVWDGSEWEIFYQQLGSSMGIGATFHVHVLPHDAASFLHVATPANITDNWTEISHPDADGNPDAHIQVTKRLTSGSYHPEPIGVWYEDATGRWNIYNEDVSAMAVDSTFVVRVK